MLFRLWGPARALQVSLERSHLTSPVLESHAERWAFPEPGLQVQKQPQTREQGEILSIASRFPFRSSGRTNKVTGVAGSPSSQKWSVQERMVRCRSCRCEIMQNPLR